MSRVVVIGIGSPMENDRIAWEVIDALVQDELLQPNISAGLTILKSDRPGSRLLEYMEGSDSAILIDALQGEYADAHLRLTPSQLQEEALLLSSHGFGVAETLQLGQKLSSLPQDVIIYGVAAWAEPGEIASAVRQEVMTRCLNASE